jgi:glycosyltransferase involved in cell wall biosynthesis
MQISIFIPNYLFFKRYGYVGGHIEHLRGTIEGFLNNNFDVHLITSVDAKDIYGQLPTDNPRFYLQCIRSPFASLGYKIGFSMVLMHRLLFRQEGMIYVRYSASFLPVLLLALITRRLFGLNNMFIVEANNFGSNYYHYRWLTFLEKFLGKFDFKLILVSEDLRQHWLKICGPNALPKVHIVPNGIMAEKVIPVRSGQAGFNRLTYLGKLLADHGLEEFLQSFKDSSIDSDTVLNIVGEGPLRACLEKRFASKRIVFHGPKVGEELYTFLSSQKTTFVYPGINKHPYQSPVKLHDYLAFGGPIISCRQKNTVTLLQDFKANIVCDINDPVALAAAVCKLRQYGSELDDWVYEDQSKAIKRFNWTDKIFSLLEEMENCGTAISKGIK